jgi:hypothetical protein
MQFFLKSGKTIQVGYDSQSYGICALIKFNDVSPLALALPDVICIFARRRKIRSQ